MKTRKPGTSEEIRQSARFKLFVEGDKDDGFDKTVLSELLEDSITIEVMGPSFYIKSVAEAMIYAHPNYFFLVDRDDVDEHIVEDSWKNFPDPKKLNLLYWRRKEIENYFLIPDFICSSNYFVGKKEEYIKKLEDEATKRVYLDTANLVISFLRNTLKANWITYFQHIKDFKTKEGALKQFSKLRVFEEHKLKTGETLSIENIKHIFENKIEEIVGKETGCLWGTGRWDYFLSGKKLLNSVISTGMFIIKDRNDEILQGNIKLREIAKALLRTNNNLPDDFLKLKEIIFKIIK